MRCVSRYSESVTRIAGSTIGVRDLVVRLPLLLVSVDLGVPDPKGLLTSAVGAG